MSRVTRRNINEISNNKDDEYVDPSVTTGIRTEHARETADKMRFLSPRLTMRNRKRVFHIILKVAGLLFIFSYVLVPIVIVTFPGIQRALIFLSFAGRPWFFDFTHPENAGLTATKNFYIETEERVKLGTWHILPKSLSELDDHSEDFYELSLRKGLPVILYMHGNSGSRAGSHRVELYKVLQALDAHVIAFDYRGYADSSPVSPTEEGAVRDGKSVFRWLKQRTGNSPIFVWGHSLGTGVSTRAVSELCQEGDPPKGLVLESPFSNMNDEIKLHPFAKLFQLVPWFQWASDYALKANNILFESDKHITGVSVPVVVLHAEDDNIIPVELGRKLYQAAVDSRPKSSPPVSLILFDGEHGYGHRYICRAPMLPNYIKSFLTKPDTKLSS